MEAIIYLLIFVGVIAGLGVWIMRARSAMKSAGQKNTNDERNFPPPSTMR